ncbi:hypothetical protein GW17_00024652 [Ensete ventricosum]|nr:hypothetical protein GW17_00024652 [Ensete ventricosum]RZS12704.1 hypothetical protein BHM03_00044181 [Ensete ventricosum]
MRQRQRRDVDKPCCGLAVTRKREKKNETFATGEPRDDAANEENLARRRLLRYDLLLIATRKRGGLNNVAESSHQH